MSTKACLFLFTLLTGQAIAQSDSLQHKRIQYWNNFLAGGLTGGDSDHRETNLSFATTHGVRFNRLAVGLGAGFDAYGEWKIFPLFASVSFDFARIKKDAFYVQVNNGYSVVRYSDWKDGGMDNGLNVNTHGGRMFNPMVGYRIAAARLRVYIAMGYKFQQNNYSYSFINNFPTFAPDGTPYEYPAYHVKQNMERFVVQIGFGWH